MRRTGGAAAVLAGLALAIVPATGPAWAHEAKLKLEVAGDGATGVTVQARHADGHGLEKTVRLVLNATGPDGRNVGPVQLEPAGEGQGFYLSGSILTPGNWKVTVRAPAPYSGQDTAEVRATAAQSAPPAAARLPAPVTDSRSGWLWWPIGLGGVAAVGAVLALAVRRRRNA
jgi:hypothetical protein